MDTEACLAAWIVRETQNLLIAVCRRPNNRPSRLFANSGLISFFFLVAFSRLAFWSCSQVFAKRSFLSVSSFNSIFEREKNYLK